MGRQIKTYPEIDPDMYKIVKKRCGKEQIRKLLLQHQPKATKTIHGTAVNKKQLIANLQTGVQHKDIPINAVRVLIQDSEENGNQHIFYFQARSRAAARRLSRGKEIDKCLRKRIWKSRMHFPMFKWDLEQSTWADFRAQGVGGKKSDWLAKIYWMDTHLHWLEDIRHGNLVTKKFEEETKRIVVVVRWNSPNLLEVRIERSEYTSRAAVQTKLQSVLNQMCQCLDEVDFKEWDLGIARRRLLEGGVKHKGMYILGDTTLRDSHSGGAMFFPQTEKEGMTSPFERREAIKVYMKRKCTCRNLIVTWLEEPSYGKLKRNLRTIMGGYKTNEVIIQSRVSPQAVDYVTNRLRQFNHRWT